LRKIPIFPLNGNTTLSSYESIPLKIIWTAVLRSTCFSMLTFEVSLMSEFYQKFVSTLEGQIKVIFRLGSSTLRDSINPFTANLDAQYTDLKGNPIIPESDEITTSWLFEVKTGKAALIIYAYPRKFVFIMFSIVEGSSMSQNLEWAPTPAFKISNEIDVNLSKASLIIHAQSS